MQKYFYNFYNFFYKSLKFETYKYIYILDNRIKYQYLYIFIKSYNQLFF